MPQKLTLAGYLTGRGAVKALTRIEAEVFGIPYPLQSGWPAKHAALEITAEMLEQLAGRIASAKQSTASKARRGLDGVESVTSVPPPAIQPMSIAVEQSAKAEGTSRMTSFPGFVLRLARRSHPRRSAPWT